MPRPTNQDLESAVLDVVNKAPGGVISHNALVAQLEAAGKGEAAKVILPLSQNKRINALVHSVPGQKPELRYTKVGA